MLNNFFSNELIIQLKDKTMGKLLNTGINLFKGKLITEAN